MENRLLSLKDVAVFDYITHWWPSLQSEGFQIKIGKCSHKQTAWQLTDLGTDLFCHFEKPVTPSQGCGTFLGSVRCQRLDSRLLPCFSHAPNSVCDKGGRTMSSIAVLPHTQAINKIIQPIHTNIYVFFKCTSGHMFYLWFIQLLLCPVLVYTKLTYGNKISLSILLFVGLCSK